MWERREIFRYNDQCESPCACSLLLTVFCESRGLGLLLWLSGQFCASLHLPPRRTGTIDFWWLPSFCLPLGLAALIWGQGIIVCVLLFFFQTSIIFPVPGHWFTLSQSRTKCWSTPIRNWILLWHKLVYTRHQNSQLKGGFKCGLFASPKWLNKTSTCETVLRETRVELFLALYCSIYLPDRI